MDKRFTTDLYNEAFLFLKETMDGYALLSDTTWAAFQGLCTVKQAEQGSTVLMIGDIPNSFFFVVQGLLRAYSIGGKAFDKEVNKIFFDEGRFPGSVPALLTHTESTLGIEVLEDSLLIEIDYTGYHRLLEHHDDLRLFHIVYLEKHWVIEKEIQEISSLIDDAKQRYINFMRDYPGMVERVPLHHIASRLGITPTQLSRVRRLFR